MVGQNEKFGHLSAQLALPAAYSFDSSDLGKSPTGCFAGANDVQSLISGTCRPTPLSPYRKLVIFGLSHNIPPLCFQKTPYFRKLDI